MMAKRLPACKRPLDEYEIRWRLGLMERARAQALTVENRKGVKLDAVLSGATLPFACMRTD
jgi:hypothetical protein